MCHAPIVPRQKSATQLRQPLSAGFGWSPPWLDAFAGGIHPSGVADCWNPDHAGWWQQRIHEAEGHQSVRVEQNSLLLWPYSDQISIHKSNRNGNGPPEWR